MHRRASPVETAGANELRQRLLAELLEKEALTRVSSLALSLAFPAVLPAVVLYHMCFLERGTVVLEVFFLMASLVTQISR